MLNLIIGSCIATCVGVAILSYKSYANVLIKLIVLPLVISVSILMIIYFMGIRGTPIKGYPEDGFVYVHHEIEQGGEEITLWIKDVRYQNKMFTFPYNRDILKKLNEMKEEKEESNQEGPAGEFIIPNGNEQKRQLIDYNYGEISDGFNEVKKPQE